MYFITTKRMLEVCFFQHTPTFIIEPKKVTEIVCFVSKLFVVLQRTLWLGMTPDFLLWLDYTISTSS